MAAGTGMPVLICQHLWLAVTTPIHDAVGDPETSPSGVGLPSPTSLRCHSETLVPREGSVGVVGGCDWCPAWQGGAAPTKEAVGRGSSPRGCHTGAAGLELNAGACLGTLARAGTARSLGSRLWDFHRWPQRGWSWDKRPQGLAVWAAGPLA